MSNNITYTVEQLKSIDYFDAEGINNSSLSKLNPMEGGSYNRFLRHLEGKDQEETTSLAFGDMLHKMILEPEKVKVITEKAPTGQMKELFDKMLMIHRNVDPLPKINDSFIDRTLNIKDHYGLMTNIKKKKTWESKVLEYESYWREVQRTGKDDVIVGINTHNRLLKAQQAVLSNSSVRYHLTDAIEFDGWQIINELPYFFDYQGRRCKIKVDKLIYDSQKNVVIDLDVKTTSKSVAHFDQSMRHFHYYRQRAFYQLGLQIFAEKELGMTEPKIHSYIAAIGSTEPFESRMFYISDVYINAGMKEIDFLFDYLKACERHIDLEEIEVLEPPREFFLHHHSFIMRKRRKIKEHDDPEFTV